MMYMTERRILAARGDANAYIRSDYATYQRCHQHPPPSGGGAGNKRKAAPDPMGHYTIPERALVREMRPMDLIAYQAIRDAAEAGAYSPSYRDLEDLLGQGGGSYVTQTLGRLEKLGAIRQIAKRPRMAFRLPAAGIQTAVWQRVSPDNA